MICDPPARDTPVTVLLSQPINLPGPAQLDRRDGLLSARPRVETGRVYLPYAAR
jgi:hypothetical protein